MAEQQVFATKVNLILYKKALKLIILTVMPMSFWTEKEISL